MTEKKKLTIVIPILTVLLIISLIGNGIQSFKKSKELDDYDPIIYQENGNSRDTYFTIHHVKEAWQFGKGKGIKVGILDAYFAFDEYPDLYTDGQDFSNEENGDALKKWKSHGWSMAYVLREIAPECEIYALNISHESEDKKVDSLIAAIDWAIQSKLDVLTLSQEEISKKNRERFDRAVNKAIENGIVTTFIHYDNPKNLLPYSTTPYLKHYNREPDVNIYHYDYNDINIDLLREFNNRQTPPDSGDDVPYFSYSSMSPVLAGFVAILKSIDNTLTPEEYKQLLIDTSYSMEYKGVMRWENGISEHTVDINKAASVLSKK